MSCEHEYEELLDENGNSTHYWICKNCGRARGFGLSDVEEAEPRGDAKGAPADRWVPDPVSCADILRTVSRGGKSPSAIYASVKGEIGTAEALSAYLEYLVSLGYLASVSKGHRGIPRLRYAITKEGAETLTSISEGIERLVTIFPREARRVRRHRRSP